MGDMQKGARLEKYAYTCPSPLNAESFNSPLHDTVTMSKKRWCSELGEVCMYVYDRSCSVIRLGIYGGQTRQGSNMVGHLAVLTRDQCDDRFPHGDKIMKNTSERQR